MNLLNFLLEEYEHEARHRIAQYNAALPIEQGGLGLHKDNTSMDRAKALGFHTEAYHGTRNDFDKFAYIHNTVGSLGKGFYFATNPTLADEYAGEYFDASRENSHPNVLKVLLKGKFMKDNSAFTPKQLNNIRNDSDKMNPYDLSHYKGGKLIQTIGHGFNNHDMMHDSIIKHTGYNGVILKDGRTNNIINVFKPHHIRSIHAAFDPMKKDSDDILA